MESDTLLHGKTMILFYCRSADSVSDSRYYYITRFSFHDIIEFRAQHIPVGISDLFTGEVTQIHLFGILL